MCVCWLSVLVCSVITSAPSLFQRAYSVIVEAWDKDNGSHSNGKALLISTSKTPPHTLFVIKMLPQNLQ